MYETRYYLEGSKHTQYLFLRAGDNTVFNIPGLVPLIRPFIHSFRKSLMRLTDTFVAKDQTPSNL